MKLFKGFSKDLTCKDFQFEIGKEYKEKKADLCNCGFHACENPLDVLRYYSPRNDARFCEVELEGMTDQKEADSKRCGKSIKIGAEIGFKGLVDAFVRLVIEKADGNVAQGDNGHAASQGYNGHAASQGYNGHAASQGKYGHAASQGYNGHAASQGKYGHAEAQGPHSIAASFGIDGTAQAELGCWLVLAEWECTDVEWIIKDVQAVFVDGDAIKAGVKYRLSEGAFVEAAVGK